jgi:hypothetical protein
MKKATIFKNNDQDERFKGFGESLPMDLIIGLSSNGSFCDIRSCLAGIVSWLYTSAFGSEVLHPRAAAVKGLHLTVRGFASPNERKGPYGSNRNHAA